MTIQDIHNWIDFLTNKAQGVYFSHEEKDMALDRGQMQYFNEQYAYYALAQKIQESLSPFKTKYSFLTSDTQNGLITAPSDYLYLTGGKIVYMEGSRTRYKALKVLSDDELAYRLNSQLRPVTITSPVAVMAGKVSGISLIQLYPKQTFAGEIDYLRRPAVPKYAYTQSGRAFAYDPTNSVQLEWGESELNELIMRALSFLGISIDDQLVTQYAEAKSKSVN
jgi:hypothetical protein